jgi:hypothetical protein
MQAGVDVRQTTAGLKGFELINLRFFDGQNNQINNDNFAPDTFGNVWVIAREITVTSYAGDKDYDSNPYVITPFIAFGQLAPGDTIEFDLPEFIERGTYLVRVQVISIRNTNDDDVTGSYKINYADVQIVIT